MNTETLSAANYHWSTGYRRHELKGHGLDWANQPVLTKRYPDLPRIALDPKATLPDLKFFQLSRRNFGIGAQRANPPAIGDLSCIFRLAYDVTARAMSGNQPFYFRSVASAGALYPFELYLAVHDVDGLDSGVYYYDVLNFSLIRLRHETVPTLPAHGGGVSATFYITGIFFRSSWKYRDRAYRYVLLDAGHLLENLRLAMGALDFPFSIHLDFDDRKAATLLGLDPDREACLAAIHLHADRDNRETPPPATDPKPLGPDFLQASTVSGHEIAYPVVLEAHHSGSRIFGDSKRDFPPSVTLEGNVGAWTDLGRPEQWEAADYVRVLMRRRSHRNFIPTAVSKDRFTSFLQIMVDHMGAASAMPPTCQKALATGILLGDHMPQPAGFYLLDHQHRRLGRIRQGRFVVPMASACLDQMWLKHAAFHLLFLADLDFLDRAWGARGYRYAMIEAGRLGQLAYLTATALGWGGCGIGAIYDWEAAALLDLPTDFALLYLVGAGPVKRRLK